MDNLNEEGEHRIEILMHYNIQLMILRGINHLAPLRDSLSEEGPHVFYANTTIWSTF